VVILANQFPAGPGRQRGDREILKTLEDWSGASEEDQKGNQQLNIEI
jgi:hypothetical protein